MLIIIIIILLMIEILTVQCYQYGLSIKLRYIPTLSMALPDKKEKNVNKLLSKLKKINTKVSTSNKNKNDDNDNDNDNNINNKGSSSSSSTSSNSNIVDDNNNDNDEVIDNKINEYNNDIDDLESLMYEGEEILKKSIKLSDDDKNKKVEKEIQKMMNLRHLARKNRGIIIIINIIIIIFIITIYYYYYL